MKNRFPMIGLFVFLCLPLVPQARDIQTVAPDRSAIIKTAREIMQKVRYCTLITMGEDGQPQARVVDPFFPGEDMSVWIATNPITRKVRQIRKNPRVTLLYFDQDGMGYVTLLGKAKLVKDPAEKAKHWKEDWAFLYKDKNHGDDYILIRVDPSRMEIVSFSHKLENDPKTWRPLTLDLR